MMWLLNFDLSFLATIGDGTYRFVLFSVIECTTMILCGFFMRVLCVVFLIILLYLLSRFLLMDDCVISLMDFMLYSL